MMGLSSKISSVFVLAALFVGCGGAPNENPNYLERNDLGRDITVTLSGASGAVSISLGSRTVSFSEDGTQEIGGMPPSGDIVATIGDTPEGQECFFSPSNLASIVAGAQVDIVCSEPGISGSIKNFFTGAIIADASVNVIEIDGDAQSNFTTVISDANGMYEVAGTSPGNRYVVSVSAVGFAPQTLVGLPTASRPSLLENILMVPENGTAEVDPTGSMAFSVGGVTVLEIPADGLVDIEGNSPVGNVTARMTLIDPSSGATALPGRYEYLSGGGVSFIETFGGLSIVLVDSTGEPLSLMDGVNATVTIPVATRAIGDGPTAASIYLFDQNSAYWSSPSAATLISIGGVEFYQASVSSLSTVFASGRPLDVVQVDGCIEDSSQNGVVGATILVQGESYIGTSYALSDGDGAFSVVAGENATVFVYGVVGSRSRTLSLTTTEANTTLSACLLFDFASTVITLTWGEIPGDLDSHLYGPIPDSSSRFHVDYTDKSVTVGSVTVFLDVDDVTSFGPEITTIPQFPVAGIYEFYVDHFSGGGDIFESPARVELNQRGESFTFSPPSGTPTLCWHVFNIEVDSSLRGSVVSVNEWIADRDVCTNTGQVTPGSDGGSRFEKVSLGQQAILEKYYSR